MDTYVMQVAGMTCDSCNDHVAEALSRPGATDIVADWRKGEARFSAQDPDFERLSAEITGAGYGPGAVRHVTSATPREEGHLSDADYDLAIVGSGSAAFAAAIRASDLGARVAMIERGEIGGTCVNVGCVPSKAMLRAAEACFRANHPVHRGVPTTCGPVDLDELVRHTDELVADLRQQKYLDLVTAYGFELIRGEARFVGPEALDVEGRRIVADRYLVATGASPAVPPIQGLAEAGYLTSTDALQLRSLPPAIAVIGANAIGLELGQLFLHLGSRVEFFDVAERIAPFEEPEVSDALSTILEGEGAGVHPVAQITAVRADAGRRIVVAEIAGASREFPVDEVLVAAGRRPNTADLVLSAAGVQVDERGAIVIDERSQTTNPRIFAAGDCTGAPQFVYVAAHQGALAAENALSAEGRTLDLSALPRVTFTNPQIAAVGVTEAQAREAGHEVKVSELGLDKVPRALVNRDTRGLVKLVADARTDRLLGASMLAEGAGDAIQAAVLAVKFGLTTRELAETFHPYLTMAEALKLAAQAFDRDVALLSCCAA
ncbi:MAG: mercury(II) reductase [Actinomycetota bacterium]